MLTEEQIAEWKRLAEAATPGPWELTYGAAVKCLAGRIRVDLDDGAAEIATADFLASARTAVPALLAEVAELRAEVAGVSVSLSGAVAAPGFRSDNLGSLVLSERMRLGEAEAEVERLRAALVAIEKGEEANYCGCAQQAHDALK